MKPRTIVAGSLFFSGSVPFWILSWFSTGSFTNGLIVDLFNPFFFVAINLLVFGSAIVYHGLAKSSVVTIRPQERSLNGTDPRAKKLKRIGLPILTLGAVLTYFGRASFVCDPINPITHLETCQTHYFQPIWPNTVQQAADGTFGFGAVVLVVGAVLVAASFSRFETNTAAIDKVSSARVPGWVLLGIGVAVATTSTIAANTVSCFGCSPYGPCYCGVEFVIGMILGLVVSLVGLGIVLKSSKNIVSAVRR